MKYAVANNARTKLRAPLLAGSSIAKVESLDLFPLQTDPYLLSINDEIMVAFPHDDPVEGPVFEITERGSEGTSPANHVIGNTVENRFTAGTYQALVDNIMDAAITALWAEIAGKPSTFTPSPHDHAWSEVISKPSTFTPSAHTHTSAQITDFWDFWIGVPIPWYTETPPVGFIELNGAAISRSVYSELYSKYGTRFGAGNGSTTFNVPDLRGEFIRGWDNGRGVDVGRELGSVQGDEFKEHNHYSDIRFNKLSARADDIDGAATTAQTDAGGGATEYRIGQMSDYWEEATLKSTGGSETRPRNVAFMYIARYQ